MKINFPIYITRRHIEKVKVRLHSFLISSLGGGKWSVSITGRFISREQLPISIKLENGGAPEWV